MTLSALIRSTSIFALSSLFAATGLQAQNPHDTGAVWEPMFEGSGTLEGVPMSTLAGSYEPVLGLPWNIELRTPGNSFGFVAVSRGAHAGQTISVAGDDLRVYLDLAMSLGTYALPLPPTGFGQIGIPIPNAPALAGLDIAFQGLVLDNHSRLGATNLLAANLGIWAGGPAMFAAFQFGPINMGSNRYYPSNQHKSAIVHNATTAAKTYTIKGTRNTGGGTLQIRNSAGTVVASFDNNTPLINVTLSVPAGDKLYFYVSGSNVNQVSWTICVN